MFVLPYLSLEDSANMYTKSIKIVFFFFSLRLPVSSSFHSVQVPMYVLIALRGMNVLSKFVKILFMLFKKDFFFL